MFIFGITGHAGHGKDTLAKEAAEMVRAAGGVPLVTAFADALRAEAAEAFDVPVAKFLDREAKEQPHSALTRMNCDDNAFASILATHGAGAYEPQTPRYILQLWGTEYRRRLNDANYWIDRMHDRILLAMQQEVTHVFITDCRFVNEAAYVRSVAGWMLRVIRADVPVNLSHRSELEQRLIQTHATFRPGPVDDDYRAQLATLLNALINSREEVAI